MVSTDRGASPRLKGQAPGLTEGQGRGGRSLRGRGEVGGGCGEGTKSHRTTGREPRLPEYGSDLKTVPIPDVAFF